MLLVKVDFNCFFAPAALLEVLLLLALLQFVGVVIVDFDDLSASYAIGKHETLQHIVEV